MITQRLYWSNHQVVFLRGLSKNLLSKYDNENLVLGGDFNCLISASDKRGGKPVDITKASTIELNALIKTQNLLDTWRYKNPHCYGPTWANPSMKIQCRLDHLFVSNEPSIRIYESKIIPNIYSDHSAVVLSISFSQHEPPRGPGFWKFNNSLLSDTKYVELLNFLIPEFAKKHQGTVDKGLFWEMIKMEIRAFTIKFSKRKAKSKRDEECALLSEMIKLQCKLQTEYSDSLRSELERIKTKLSRIASVKTHGTIIRSRARWYEHGEKNSKYFYNLEKTNQTKKHITSLKISDHTKLTDPKEILEEEERFFKQIYTSKSTNSKDSEFIEFFNTENALSEETAKTCEGVMSVEECKRALMMVESKKHQVQMASLQSSIAIFGTLSADTW